MDRSYVVKYKVDVNMFSWLQITGNNCYELFDSVRFYV